MTALELYLKALEFEKRKREDKLKLDRIYAEMKQRIREENQRARPNKTGIDERVSSP